MLKKKRLEEVLKRMSRMGIDQMIITDPISILYLTEVWIDACERLVALYINKNGKNYLFVNNMFSVPEKNGSSCNTIRRYRSLSGNVGKLHRTYQKTWCG